MWNEARVAVLGGGTIGESLIAGLLRAGALPPEHLTVTARRSASAARLSSTYGVCAGTDNREAVDGADLILLCVKPGTVPEVLDEIRPHLHGEQLLISVAASVPLAVIEERVPGGVPVVRAMPNTAVRIGYGITGLCAGSFASAAHLEQARSLFSEVGHVVEVDERHMDAVTGLAASGPAFIYVVIEAMAEGGVKAGLPRDTATALAAQAVRGAGAMVLETGEHPALLKDMVTTPAGCTIDGLMELEAGGLRVTLIRSVVRATERAGDH